MYKGQGLFKEEVTSNNGLGILCRKITNNRHITKKQKRKIVGIYNHIPKEERYSFINRIVKSIEFEPDPKKAIKKLIRTYSETLRMTYSKIESCYGCDCCTCKI